MVSEADLIGGLEAVLFDATGTLIEPAEPIGESYARIAAAYGVELSAARLSEAFGQVFQAAPPLCFPDAHDAEIPELERRWWRDRVRETFVAVDSVVRLRDPDACFEALWRHFAAARAWRPRPGAQEALRTLRARGLATAVVSNFDGRLHGILEGLGLSSLLDSVVLPGDARALKPDAAIFELALERLGVPPPRALFVGDDLERDCAGARRAGLRALHVGELATLADLAGRLTSGSPG